MTHQNLKDLESELAVAEANSSKAMKSLSHWRRIVLKLKEKIKEAKGEGR